MVDGFRILDRRTFAADGGAAVVNDPSTTSRRPRFKKEAVPFLKLPKGRTLSLVMSVCVAPNGHVWIAHTPRLVTPGMPDSPADIAARLPPLVEFDADGNFIQAWGGPDHLPQIDGKIQWPQVEETVHVDDEGMVWIFGSTRAYDHGVMRFTPDGKLLLRIGKFGVQGDDTSRDLVGCPTDVYMDVKSREAFLADGYCNHRVVSFNADTGQFVRAWGAYAKPLPTGPDLESFSTPVHSITKGPDGFLYVCDRIHNRIQVFDAIGKKDVRFVRELEVAVGTQLFGSTFQLAFSPDGAYMYVTDGSNNRIWIVDMKAWKTIGWFGGEPLEGTGNTAVKFNIPHRMAADRNGNVLIARSANGFERYLFQGVS